MPYSCTLSVRVTKKSGWQFIRNEKSYRRSAGVKTTQFSWAFPILKMHWIFEVRIFGFWAISQEQKELPEVGWSQNGRVLGAFQIF